MTKTELIALRDRIGMMNLHDPHMAHEVLQRLTWIMPDPSIINEAITDMELNPRGMAH